MNKGNLIRVRHPDGHYSKMYEADAVEQGLVPGSKLAPQPENKLLPAGPTKGEPPAQPSEPTPPADDFTKIPGIGLAAARLLVANGITTFAQLRAAGPLSYVSKKAGLAIEAWRRA